NDLGLDEATLEVSVDHTSSLRRGSTLLDGPGTRFLWTCRQISLQPKRGETGLGQRMQAGFFLADGFEQLRGFLVVKLQQLRFRLRVQEHAVGGSHEVAQLSPARLVGKHTF